MFGGLNPFDLDPRVVDNESIVRNLQSNRVEIRERIFVDKPKHKQLEITLDLKSDITPVSIQRRKVNGNLAAGADTNGAKSFQPRAKFDDPEDREEEKKGDHEYRRGEDDFLYGKLSG